MKDTKEIFSLGKRWILRCLLKCKFILDRSESRHFLSRLYIDDYCVWIQYLKLTSSKAFSYQLISSTKLRMLSQALDAIRVSKTDISWPLMELEQIEVHEE